MATQKTSKSKSKSKSKSRLHKHLRLSPLAKAAGKITRWPHRGAPATSGGSRSKKSTGVNKSAPKNGTPPSKSRLPRPLRLDPLSELGCGITLQAWRHRGGSSSQKSTDGNLGNFKFLGPMLNIYLGYDRARDLLQDKYPWLRELSKFDREQLDPAERAFEGSVKAFNADPHLFMVALRLYVLAERDLELYVNFVEDGEHGARALHLLSVLRMYERTGTVMTENLTPSATCKVSVEKACIPAEDREACEWTIQMVQSRRGTDVDASSLLRKVDWSYFKKETRLTLAAFDPHLEVNEAGPERNLFLEYLEEFNKRYQNLRSSAAEEIAFNVFDTSGLWASPMWLQIGRNLSRLAELLGVDAQEWSNIDIGSPGIIAAFGTAEQRSNNGASQVFGAMDRGSISGSSQVQRLINEQAGITQRQGEINAALRFHLRISPGPAPDFSAPIPGGPTGGPSSGEKASKKPGGMEWMSQRTPTTTRNPSTSSSGMSLPSSSPTSPGPMNGKVY